MTAQYNEKRYRLMDALVERKGIQHLVDTAAEVFGNPVFIGDISMNILCHSQNGPADAFWTQVSSFGYASESIVKDCNRSGGFGDLYHTDRPRINYFAFSSHPFLSARIRDGMHVMGHVCIYGCNQAFTDKDFELIVLLCKVLAYEMLYRGLSSGGDIPYFSLMADLLSQPISSERDILTRAANAHCRIPLPMRIVVLQSTQQHKTTMYFLREHLATELTDSMVIVYGEDIVAFCASISEKWSHNANIFENVLHGGGYSCGISREISALSNIQEATQQAYAVLESVPKQQTNSLNYYDNCYLYHLFSLIDNKKKLLEIVDPRLIKLQAYDQKKNTDLFLTLRTYLQCNRNMNLAAEKLCIHKNSMYYRRDTIESLLGEKLTNEQLCLALEVSYRILEFCELI